MHVDSEDLSKEVVNLRNMDTAHIYIFFEVYASY